MKPCNHTPSRDGCRLCWLYDNDARYRALWGGDPATVSSSVTTTSATPPGAPPAPAMTPEQLEMVRKIKLHMATPCAYLGKALEEKPSCGCGGTLAIRHECRIFDECRISSRDNLLKNCVSCDSYSHTTQGPIDAN